MAAEPDKSTVDIESELERIHDRSFGWAVACCRGDREMAEEVLQTNYLRVLEGKARFGGSTSLILYFTIYI